MGPSHSMSGAAAWLGATAVYTVSTGNEIAWPVLVLGTAVTAGAALAPDIDSYGSTVVRSFGIFGRVMYWIANGLSLGVYGILHTHKDGPKENGHRTLFHTTLMAILSGLFVSFASSAGGTTELWGQQYSWGAIWAIVFMGIFLHLALGGLFVKPISKARSQFGPYLMMVFTAGLTIAIAFALGKVGDASTNSYWWLGLAVGFGWFVHLMGDFITKMGVPLLFPIPWRGRLWWNFATPTFMRITAGGGVENYILMPLFTILTIGLATWHILVYNGLVQI